MGESTREADDREAAINLAIYDYHAAVDRGESPDPAEWAVRNPEIAAELNAYFDDVARLGLLRPPKGDDSLAPTGTLGEPEPPGLETRAPTADFRPGDVLGDYVLLEQLGAGGQGVVWKARPQNSREIVVALKTLRGPASGDLASFHRLRADARAIARMKHDNIIRTFYFGEDRGRWFFVMELMEGGTVADRLASYRVDPRAAAVLMEKVARAIHHAHSRNPGVLHLDLKPGNILLTADGQPRVTDFGLSVRVETIDPPGLGAPMGPPTDPDPPDDLSATFARAGIVGTLPFLSPEMAGGLWSEVSTASDIYGLGAVLYTMLTGREPFRGKDAGETLALIRRGDLTSARALNPAVDRELNAICVRCLNREPGRRYGSADALANDLRRWLGRRPTLAGGKPSAVREARFWARRHPLWLLAVGIVLVLLWLGGIAVSVAELRAENVQEAARLASQVDRELRLIRRATQILARDPRLHAAFTAGTDPDPAAGRRGAIEEFLKSAIESENLFGIAGGNPFVNIFVLGPNGVLLADSMADSPAVGQSFAVRDYYRAFFEPGSPRPRDEVYVARSFRSVKDGRYKIAISTRVWGNRGELLGLLVANFTIGPRLIDVDLRQELGDVAVLCPMDRSDPAPGADNHRRIAPYIAVLDRQYADNGGVQPATFPSPQLPDFQGNSTLGHVTRGPWGGRFVDYHRVGQTHLVVVLRRQCPWPLSWLPEFP
jgi:serine/threonine-protein kinase